VKCHAELRKKFVEEQQGDLLLWNSLKQKNQSIESIDEFGTKVANLGTLLKLADPLVILKLKEGIADEMVRIKILRCRCDSLEKVIEKANQFKIAEKLGRKHTPQVNTVEYKQKQFSDKKPVSSQFRPRKKRKEKTKWPAPFQEILLDMWGPETYMSRDRPNKKTEPSVNLPCKDDAKKSEERKLARINIYVEGRSLPCMLDSGAQLELMREDVAKQLEIKLDRITTNGTNFNAKIEPAKVKPHEVTVITDKRITDPRIPRFPKKIEEKLLAKILSYKMAGTWHSAWTVMVQRG